MPNYIGPKSLYPEPKSSNHTDVPLVMRDAVQKIAVGTRLLAVKPRIMGGQPAPIGAYPWIASLGLKGVDQRDGHFCGGAFIGPDWVITAAHCVTSESANKVQVLGGTNILAQGGTTYLVSQIIVHEQYDGNTSDNDVALLRLEEPFAGQAIRLLTTADVPRLAAPGNLAVVAGWGLTEEGGDVSTTLRHVTVQIASNKACNGLTSYSGSITDNMICAGFADGGKDSCQGDSGGPLMVADGSGSYLLAGVVSFGEGCGRPNKFGVYTNIANMEPWVAGKIAAGRTAARARARPAAKPAATPGSTSRASVETRGAAAKRRITAPAKRAAPKTGNSISYREIDQLIRR